MNALKSIFRAGAIAALVLSGLSPVVSARSAPAATVSAVRPDQVAFRDLYKTLVETNTTLSSGDCTLAASRMAARLKAAGYPDADLHPFQAEGHPKEGGLVAVLHGTDPKEKGVLLLAHIDVVEAKPEDWVRDPFTLVEEGGYFYARGSSDDKAQAAIWVDTLIRLRQQGFKPRRDVKMALTCGEETASAFNGAGYLATHERGLIDAAFALNEGAGGILDNAGKPVALNIQAGEKFPQDYRLEVTNPGGHSSRPTRDNAIYHLAGGLTRISQYEFPIETTDATRAFFARMAPLTGGELGAAMAAFAKDPTDAKAIAVLENDPGANGMIHTTCVATMLDGGHATNALPQRARANINCRIFPGATAAEVRDTLEKLVADPEVKVTTLGARSEVTKGAPPLTAQIMKPIQTVAGRMWPGVPIIPLLQPGATDGAFLAPVGIPTYGLSGIFSDRSGNGVHGLNERILVKSLYDGRDFLFDLVKIYATQQ
jgi:acetylornithine deacetylase/succinyl-diaminopimelate desuccinylase-like protein